MNMKACVSNMSYSWLTFLLTFLAGRLMFFLTLSYKVRTVWGAHVFITTQTFFATIMYYFVQCTRFQRKP